MNAPHDDQQAEEHAAADSHREDPGLLADRVPEHAHAADQHVPAGLGPPRWHPPPVIVRHRNPPSHHPYRRRPRPAHREPMRMRPRRIAHRGHGPVTPCRHRTPYRPVTYYRRHDPVRPVANGARWPTFSSSLGPDAPTLCEGWTTRDLAAHLVVRERRPDAAAGLLLAAAARARRAGARRRGRRRRTRSWSTRSADAPWWSPVSNPLTDGLANSLEFFIHHEDVRRAQPGWQPRELPAEQQDGAVVAGAALGQAGAAPVPGRRGCSRLPGTARRRRAPAVRGCG